MPRTKNKKKPHAISKAKEFAQIENIAIGNIRERMGPLALHVYAEAFLTAARSLSPPEHPFEPVRPYLVCHSIELGLKAFLACQGAAMLELADGSYGHNLEAILHKADERGLKSSTTLNSQQRSVIRHASPYYSGKVFEYPAVGEAFSGYPKMPAMEELFRSAKILVDELRQLCRQVTSPLDVAPNQPLQRTGLTPRR